MSGWAGIALLATAGLMLWWMIRVVRGRPEAFSRENLGKSLYTLGVLTLILFAVIFFCVMLLRMA